MCPGAVITAISLQRIVPPFGIDIRLEEKLSPPTSLLFFPSHPESFGQLVPLGFDIAAFTPAAYRRRSLQRPSNEASS